MIEGMTIGQLAARSGLSVRTLRFSADVGVLPVAGRTDAGYRVFGPDAVAACPRLRGGQPPHGPAGTGGEARARRRPIRGR